MADTLTNAEWLWANAGRWSCRPDSDYWVRQDGSRYYPGVSFSINGTGYNGWSLDDAITHYRTYNEKELSSPT